MEDLRNETISNIRSCLISIKGQVSVKQLEEDYRTLIGERIPFMKLGHKNVESFLLSVPSIVTWRTSNGELLVDAQVSEKSAHISSMVKKQKPVPVKKKIGFAPNYRTYTHPPPVTNKWRPKKNPILSMHQKRYDQSQRLVAVSHTQFVHGYKKPSVPSKIVVPEKSKQYFVPAKDAVMMKTVEAAPSPPNLTKTESKRQENEEKWEEEERDDSSPLSSTMRRISKIMSQVSVERDSGNSSPTTDFAINYKLSGDPIEDIRSFAAYHKLGDVEVKFTETFTKTKTAKERRCHCMITVGQHKYSSYPADFTDKVSAEKHASQKALDDLIQKYSRRKSLLISSNEDVIDRIPPMLEKHNNAVWCWQIEADYVDKYNEQLPCDWLRVIDNSPDVSIEKCCGGYVLKHCNPDDVLQKGKKSEMSLNVGAVSVPCNTVHFDDNNRLYVIVTAAQSANEIWCQDCRPHKYRDFEQLTVSMEKYYTQRRTESMTKTINFGSCYVICHDGAYLRVRALSMPQEGFVDCFLIDYGDQVAVSVDNVFILKREFAVLESQAFVCRLAGLEKLYEASTDSENLTNFIVGKEFVLENVVDETGDDDDVTIPVVLYDVTTSSSINEQLITLLTIESATPVLNKSSFTEVHVSNIESNGDIYVQIRTHGYHSLVEMLDQVETAPLSVVAPITRNNSTDKMYLIRCKMTQKWRRVKILDWAPTGDFAQIYYVDYGNAEVIHVDREKLYPLDKLDDVVNKYPPQAVKVRLMIDKIPKDFVTIAGKMLPEDQAVFLKIMSYDNADVAWVELYKRTADGVLVFINKNISVASEFQNFDVPSSNDINPRKRLINLVQNSDNPKNVPSGGSLKKPDLPKVGDYFNVNIPFAVNPWNFCVQPLDSEGELRALMLDMQAQYKEIQYSPMPIENVVPGNIYASKHEDGTWYRTTVLKVIHSGSISVFYCDFGYYTNLRLDQLVPLQTKYTTLPYQALKAKISGVRPIKNKWTMEDCDMFQALVTKKQFVSILVDMEKDEFHKGDIILKLLLIDTSKDDDVYIKELLIEKGIAINVE